MAAYTKSVDGRLRRTLNLKVRVTKEEFENLQALARLMSKSSGERVTPNTVLERAAGQFMDMGMHEEFRIYESEEE